MKRTCLVIAILVVAISCGCYAKASPNVESQSEIGNDLTNRICEPNTTKMQDCNRCRCSINGRAWMCTRKACPIAPNRPGFVCTPNKVFRYECNTCTCNEHGNGADCIEIGCDENPSDKILLSQRNLPITTPAPVTTTDSGQPRIGGKCKPGDRWKEDCNWCFCTSTGIGACTLKGCLTKVNLPIIDHPITKRQAINQYHPTGDEKIYTLEDLQNPNFSCTPSLSFKVECNTCWCAADGKRPRFCTRIACNPKPVPPTKRYSDTPSEIIFPK